ncbi:isoprenyl transferase [Crassaminicella indica]|uniref:Isoprenyl transferase n=1 Tax=Crassaminicella indica TaxID=2855394 RepID=A0ABX8RCD0_9CLOT|nr:isoprenyl transferase [Crassaminicella indica]QXM06114.1 isoprenyl transferase [Crassaminicella indica]
MRNIFSRGSKNLNKKDLDLEKLPKHIAVIMDGNGRWAKKRGLPRTAGHKAGIEALREIIRTCSELHIEYLTLYAFSTENWKRPVNEVSALMQLLVYYLRKEAKELHKNNVKIRTIGDISKLPQTALDEINSAVELTKNNTGLVVNIALNYGARDEIIMAVKNICQKVKNDEISIEKIDKEYFKEFLYTKDIPDPDLVIRPSGELRISNFLLWQIAYSEFWFSNTFWPDFNRDNLIQAIIDYQKRDRRFGGIK